MLVLSRKRDEKIVIGENIVVTIVEIRGDKVRLGIEEVWEAIRRTSQKASES
jgi:carbon storage regulator